MSAAVTRLAQRPSLRVGAVAVTLVLLAVGACEGWTVWRVALASPNHAVGFDLSIYLEGTRSWLAGTGFYRPRELTGQPFTILVGDVLYPPPAVLLFLPWALGMPVALWWLIPLAITAAAIAHVRPSAFAWPLLAWTLTDTRTWAIIVYGNPSMWAIAAVAAGSAWGWPAVGTLIKPIFWPFAALGFRRPAQRGRTAVAVAAFLIVGLLFLPMWPDYARAMANARTPDGPEWLFGEVPIALAIAAGLSGPRHSHRIPAAQNAIATA